MTTHLSASELAARALPGLASGRGAIRRQAQREGWQSRLEPRNGGLTVVYALASLPTAARAMLEARASVETLDAPAIERPNFDLLPEAHRAIALERVRLVGLVHAHVAEGATRQAAIERAAQAWCCEHDAVPAARTVRRWVARCEGQLESAWFALLLPQWKSSSTRSECHPDAWAYWRDDYLRAETPTYRACYRRMVDVARDQRWEPVPSIHYFIRRLAADVPMVEQILRRQGEDALLERYPSQRRDVSHLYPNWGWNADGHAVDVFVRWPDGDVGRPILVGFQDLYSRNVVGFRVDKTESAELVRLALVDAVHRYGVPEHLYIDNGRAFWTKVMTGGAASRFRFPMRADDPEGVLKAVGINAHAVKPFSGKSKPIERAWKDMCENIARHPEFAGAGTGPSTTKKPHNYGQRVVELDDFLRTLSVLVEEHNTRTGRRTQTARGRSFAQTFTEDLGERAVRKLNEDEERMLLLKSKAIQVRRGRSHIEYAGNRYWHDDLIPLEGQKIIVRFDPDRLKAGLFAYRLDGRYVAFCPCIADVGFDDERQSKEKARNERRFARAVKEAAKAATSFTQEQLSRMHIKARTGVEPEPRAANVVELVTRARVAATDQAKPATTKVRVGPTDAELAMRQKVEDLEGEAGGAALEALERRYLRVNEG